MSAVDVAAELTQLEKSMSQLSLEQRESFSTLAQHKVRPSALRERVVGQCAQCDHQAYRLRTISGHISDLRTSDSSSLVSFLQRHRVQSIMVGLYTERAADMLQLVQSKNYCIALETYCAVEQAASTSSVADIQRLFSTCEKAQDALKGLPDVVMSACQELYQRAFFLLKLMRKKHEPTVASDPCNELKTLVPAADFLNASIPMHDPHFSLDLMQHVSWISRIFSLYDSQTIQFSVNEVAGLTKRILLIERVRLQNLTKAAQGEHCTLLQEKDLQECQGAILHLRALVEQKLAFNPLVPPLLDHLDALQSLTHEVARINKWASNVNAEAREYEKYCAVALSQPVSLEHVLLYIEAFQALSRCSSPPVLTRVLTEKITELFSEVKSDNEVFLHILARKELGPLYWAGESRVALPVAVKEYLVRAVMRMRFTVQQGNIALDLAMSVLQTHPLYKDFFEKSRKDASFDAVIRAYDVRNSPIFLPQEDLEAAYKFVTSTQEATSKAKDPVAYATAAQRYYDFSGIKTPELLSLLKQIVLTLLHRCAEENTFVVPSESFEPVSEIFDGDLSKAQSSFMRALGAAIAAEQESDRTQANAVALSYIGFRRFSEIVSGRETAVLPLVFENTLQKLVLRKYNEVSEPELTLFFKQEPVVEILRTKSVPLKEPRLPIALLHVVRELDKFDLDKSISEQTMSQPSTKMLVEALGEAGFLAWYRQISRLHPLSA